MHHPHRPRWQLDTWRIQDEPDLDATIQPFIRPSFDDGGWREVPPATHLQPWLYPDNPYWGQEIRQVNDRAWWYRTRFSRPQDETSKHFRIQFDAVDYYTEAWLNGQPLGQHEGGFAPFWFDVTPLLQEENVLAVKVTSPWDPVRRKGLTYADEVYRDMVKGLYAHADGLIPPDVNPIGIWRPVWLQGHADLTIEHLAFSVREDEFDRSAHLTLRLRVRNRRPEKLYGVWHIYIAGETTEGVRVNDNYPLEVPPGEHIIEQTVRIPDPHWWWPWDMGQPDLYRLRCTLYDQKDELDVYERVVGIRRVRLLRSKNTLHYEINKTPLFVRGTTYMGGLYLSQLTPEQIAADLDRVQECHLNLIRTHVHVAPPELYEACDRRGIMVWQDFELNWVHPFTPRFEARAVRVLDEMIEHLENHVSIITWSCHNEPNALSFQDRNLTLHPDKRLYQEIRDRDPTRPAFLCSGRNEENWRQSGDTHAYIGGGHGGHYLDAHGRRFKLITEFGCEAPPSRETLDETPQLAERLSNLRDRIADLQAYQAELVKYQVEWYRMTRFEPCGGYIHFMLVDLFPQVGCGVLDVKRRPRAAFAALKAASPPVHIMMEHDRGGPRAIWVVNDRTRPLLGCMVEWQVTDEQKATVTRGSAQTDIPAQRAHRVTMLDWRLSPEKTYRVVLRLQYRGELLDENVYDAPFHFAPRPRQYPWAFDPQLGIRCYGGRHASSSLKVLNTWYGRLARLLFPVYDWAEDMLLAPKPNPRLDALLRKLFG